VTQSLALVGLLTTKLKNKTKENTGKPKNKLADPIQIKHWKTHIIKQT